MTEGVVDFRKRRIFRALLFEQLQLADGNAFQRLFGRYMHAVYGDDFSQVRPSGSLGDGGCDGYRSSTRTVYQCYGKNVSSGVDAKYVTTKIGTDFAQARRSFPGNLMNEWVFAHNIRDGLPHTAVQMIVKLDTANPTVSISHLGPSGIEKMLFELPENILETVLDVPAHSSPLSPEVIQRLLKRVAASAAPLNDATIEKVPHDKIDFNQLSETSARMIRDNAKYTRQVEKFVREDADPQFGDRVAKTLNERYLSFRAEQLNPDDIIDKILDFVVGDRHNYTMKDIKSAEAIIAYFFESCDIFEKVPVFD